VNHAISLPRVQFAQLFSATARGAHLARLLTVQHLAEWGWPPACSASQNAALVVAELAVNAAVHGRVQGRGFGLTLALESPAMLRVEVADPRGERAPVVRPALPTAEGGRGLLLVEALADGWGVEPRPPSGKTVWARLSLSQQAGGHVGQE
jgi:anti-sigma regulatory factor (Ser/Thr protein kinase)